MSDFLAGFLKCILFKDGKGGDCCIIIFMLDLIDRIQKLRDIIFKFEGRIIQ